MNNKICQQGRKVHSRGSVGWVATALIAVLALFSVATSAQAAWYDSNWQYRKMLTIDYTKVGATLNYFPVLVSLSSDTDLAADALDNGDDILFTNSDGTKLDHEIEYFNGTTGELVAWVKIPSLSNTADTDIYMYYGYGSATNQENAEGVWDDGGSDYYEGVWHLQESSGSGSYLLNSKQDAYNGNPGGSDPLANGKIAGGREGGNIDMDNGDDLLGGDTAFTLSFWGYPNYASDSEWQSAGEEWFFTSDSVWGFRIKRDSGYPAGTGWIQADVRFTSGPNYFGDTGNLLRAQWNYIVLTYDGAALQMYINGEMVKETTGYTGQALNSNNQYPYFELGDSGSSNSIDEFRYSRSGRSPEWISTEYNNQDNPGPGAGAFFKSLESEETSYLLEQEGFRFRDDDGSETGATWLADQDTNILRDKNLNTRLRVIVDATDDPISNQYQLEYKKSTDSQWLKVQAAGAGGWTFPQVTSITPSIFNTDTTNHNVAMPATVAAGDLLLVLFTNDGSATVTTPGGWTALFSQVEANSRVRASAYAMIAAGTEGGTTVNFQTSAVEQAAAQVYRILAADWYGSSVNDGVAVGAGSQATSQYPDPPAVTPAWGADNTLWIAYIGYSSTATVTSYSTNYGNGTWTQSSTGGKASAEVASARRELNASSVDPGTYTLSASSAWAGNTIAIRPSAGGGAIALAASANISDSGANTTYQLAVPSGKTTGDFYAGRIQDDENPADAVDITADYYTELEWCLIATDEAQYGDVYQFRVTASGVPLETYSVTPQWGIYDPDAPPAAPVATAATNVQATSFSANWNASLGATGYRLDVATDSGFTAFVTGYNDLDVGNVLTYSVSSNISAGTTYYYRVRAYNANGTSGDSNTISLTTAPLAPVATAATNVQATSFSANWNTSSGATGYRLDVATDSGFTAFVTGYNDLDVGNVLTYSVSSNISANTTYYYRVRAYNGSSTSGSSNTISLTTAPAAPVTTAATNIQTISFSANWNTSPGATGYRLDVATDRGFTAFVTGYNDLDVGNVLTYSVSSNIAPETDYYYRVRAYNANGTSGDSNTISLTSACAAPATIALVGSATGTTITTSTVSPSANMPSGVESGHLLLAWVVSRYNYGINTAAGWNQIGSTVVNGSDSNVALFWREADGNEGGSWTFDNLFNSNSQGVIVISAWSGVDTSDPINASNSSSATVTTVSGPSVSPTKDNTMIIQFIGADPGSAVSGTDDSSPDATEIYDFTDTGTYAHAAIQYYLQGTQAALALDYTNLTSDTYGAFQVVLNPACLSDSVTLADHTQTQVGDLFTKISPVTDVLFRFKLTR